MNLRDSMVNITTIKEITSFSIFSLGNIIDLELNVG